MTDETALALHKEEQVQIAVHKLPNPETVELVHMMSKAMAMSTLLKSEAKSADQRMSDAFVIMMMGVEMGLSPISSLRLIHVIKGTPTVSGAGMLAILKRAGVEVEMPNIGNVTDSATVRLRRPGDTEWFESTFTLQMAQTAGITSNTGWKNYPANMLIWRALSNAARMHTPDIINGLYTKEEIADAQFDADGEIIDITIKMPHWSTDERKLSQLLAVPTVRACIEDYDNLTPAQRSAAALKLAAATTWEAFETGQDAAKAIIAGFARQQPPAQPKAQEPPAEPDPPPPAEEAPAPRPRARQRDDQPRQQTIAGPAEAEVDRGRYNSKNKCFDFLVDQKVVRLYGNDSVKKLVGDDYFTTNLAPLMDLKSPKFEEIETLHLSQIEWKEGYAVAKQAAPVFTEDAPESAAQGDQPEDLDAWFPREGEPVPAGGFAPPPDVGDVPF